MPTIFLVFKVLYWVMLLEICLTFESISCIWDVQFKTCLLWWSIEFFTFQLQITVFHCPHDRRDFGYLFHANFNLPSYSYISIFCLFHEHETRNSTLILHTNILRTFSASLARCYDSFQWFIKECRLRSFHVNVVRLCLLHSLVTLIIFVPLTALLLVFGLSLIKQVLPSIKLWHWPAIIFVNWMSCSQVLSQAFGIAACDLLPHLFLRLIFWLLWVITCSVSHILKYK